MESGKALVKEMVQKAAAQFQETWDSSPTPEKKEDSNVAAKDGAEAETAQNSDGSNAEEHKTGGEEPGATDSSGLPRPSGDNPSADNPYVLAPVETTPIWPEGTE